MSLVSANRNLRLLHVPTKRQQPAHPQPGELEALQTQFKQIQSNTEEVERQINTVEADVISLRAQNENQNMEIGRLRSFTQSKHRNTDKHDYFRAKYMFEQETILRQYELSVATWRPRLNTLDALYKALNEHEDDIESTCTKVRGIIDSLDVEALKSLETSSTHDIHLLDSSLPPSKRSSQPTAPPSSPASGAKAEYLASISAARYKQLSEQLRKSEAKVIQLERELDRLECYNEQMELFKLNAELRKNDVNVMC